MEQNFLESNLLYDSDENHYYIIPEGTTLYRGESKINQNTYTLPESQYPVFFGFDKENIEKNYGITYKFTTVKEMRCIAIDKLNVNSPFYKNAPSDIQNILLSNYGLKTKERLSESDKDKVLANYICEKGLDGYAIDNMETKFDTFHAEIAICHPSEKINVIGINVTDSETAAKFKQESILIQDKKDRKKRRPLYPQSPSPKKFHPSYPNNENFVLPISFLTPPSSPISPRMETFSTPPRSIRKGGSKKKRIKRNKRNKTRVSRKYKK